MTTTPKTINKRDMTTGGIVPHILRMTWPMTIGIGSIISVSLADTYFISLLGARELAAISYSFPIVTLFFNIVFGMAIAMSATISRKVGAGEKEQVREVIVIGLAITLGLTIAMSVLFLTFSHPIFAWMGADLDMRMMIMQYMDIWLIGAVFLSIPVVANAAVRGMGDPISPAIVMVSVAVANVILDPIFIFGWFGVPAMGLEGAALASVIAYVIGMSSALWILAVRERQLILKPLFQKQSWSRATKLLIVIAIPVSMANAITPVVSFGYTAILSSLGDNAVAGFGVTTRLEAFALIPIMALAGAMAPFVGQNYGAGKLDRVSDAIKICMRFGLYYGLGCAIVLAILAIPFARAFTDNDEIFIFITCYLFYIPVSLIGLNIFLVVTSSMNAMEHPKRALILNILRSFAIALPAAFIMTRLYGLEGFLWSIILTNVISMMMAVYCIKRLDCFKRLKSLPL